jgi:hypothetical protein
MFSKRSLRRAFVKGTGCAVSYPPLGLDDNEMMHDNSVLAESAIDRAEKSREGFNKTEENARAEEAKLAFDKKMRDLEIARIEATKKREEEEEKKKREPQAMTLDSTPGDYYLAQPITDGPLTKPHVYVQKDKPLGTQTAYYSQIIKN